jgi:hypothetical protein
MNKETTARLIVRIATFIDQDIRKGVFQMPNHPKANEIMNDEIKAKLNKKYFDVKENGTEGSDARKAHDMKIRRIARKRRVSIY